MTAPQLDLFGSPDEVGPGEAAPRPAAPGEAAPHSVAPHAAALPDSGARARIAGDLVTNLLVEAGAGSGKTTELVARLVALVRTGTATTDEVAAVTFTRKAAGELRERFQAALERELAGARDAGLEDEAARLDRALREIDRAFLGTIHAFCARLLRERPLEAGLDPGFQELEPQDEVRLADAFWTGWRERLAAEAAPVLGELAAVGLDPSQLRELFDLVRNNPDVEFPAEPAPRPDRREIAPVRKELDELMDRAQSLLPQQAPASGWGSFQKRLRSLRFHRWVLDWRSSDLAFLDALAIACTPKEHKLESRNRWGYTRAMREAAARLAADFTAFSAEGGAADRLLRRWWAHRYPIALGFVTAAARDFAEERRRSGRLTFQDLLTHTAELLRRSPTARRDLGRRWRRLLVDEFQDTDPLQAEILLLLAAEPDDTDWRRAIPRSGALFVVGDPKQSIYRFRRADISVYEDVRHRFEAFGAVVRLTTNFRSAEAIGRFVDEVFGAGGLFPAEATAEQARFAPMRTRPRAEPHGCEGVFHYALHPGTRKLADAADDDAERVATWIDARIAGGEREPGDFLVLTHRKAWLERYARALEARGVPVQVTGAGVSVDEELQELMVLLESLVDPADPVRVVAVLVGLFFGLDLDLLVEHRLAGGSLDPLHPGAAGRAEVIEALTVLGEWWKVAADRPADIAIGRIVDELGLMPYAAAGDLGQLRAGALAYSLDAVRTAALDGETSLGAALEALQAALTADETEAPLEPGRTNVVRVMNLHKAKGLEAPVVVLAAPFGDSSPEPDHRIERRDDGNVIGHAVVRERDGWSWRVLARPVDWPEHAAIESSFGSAEDDRLLYVAASRAGDELVVGRAPLPNSASPWAAFEPWLERRGTMLEMPRGRAAERERLRTGRDAIEARIKSLAREREALARPSYEFEAVTTLVREPFAERPPGARAPLERAETSPAPTHEPRPDPRGASWGRALHAALEAAARGLDGERLHRHCRALLLENERPEVDGEPTELDDLLDTVARVRASTLWARAEAAALRVVEVPFALPLPPTAEHGPRRVLEGVIDLVFRESDHWVIVDYKSDAGADPAFHHRLAAYARQIRAYADAWEQMTSQPVGQMLLYFTARNEAVEVKR